MKSLTETDIRQLIRHPDENVRAMAAQRICRNIKVAALSDEERKFAHVLLDYMAKDSAEMVRRALAVTLKNSPDLPKEVALKLAEDIDNIAVPILSHSPVFTDADLVQVLKSKAAAKVLAVAKRPKISDTIVRAIIRYGDSYAVAEAAANDGADINEDTASLILDLYRDNDLIKDRFVCRRDLPVTIVEKLITLVSEEVAIRLQSRHDVSIEMAVDLAVRSRERATVDFIDKAWSASELTTLVTGLFEAGRLTPSLILRGACSGYMAFTEEALARRARVSREKAALMVHDGGPFGLKALCARAGLDDTTQRIIKAATVIYHDLEISGIAYDAHGFKKRMIQRVLTLPIEMSEADQTYFLDKLDALDAGTSPPSLSLVPS